MPPPKILVAHPGRQYSHELALALHEEDMLAGYWTGIPANRAGLIAHIAGQMSRYEPLPLPETRVRHNVWVSIANKSFRTFLPSARAVKWAWLADGWFDKWCARHLSRESFDCVICYENSALKTFQRAREIGCITILDAASFHHTRQDSFYDFEEPHQIHAAIKRRKDKEIELADHILTVSEIARESYVAAGVSGDRVSAISLGCDLSRFRISPVHRSRNFPCTFIFAGYGGARKGADVLLAASSRVQKRARHRLVFVGNCDSTLDFTHYPWVEHIGRVRQQNLNDLFQTSDCLVLPSRHDSFGMVVVEAMASGLPVIVSDHVGAKEAVAENVSGWIIPSEDVEALAGRMEWCIKNRSSVNEMRISARRAAAAYSWSAYRERVTACITNVLHPEAAGTAETIHHIDV